ncbi:MAG: toxic anion resistance protein [Deferribacteraceae bacterium]|jgi:uncharacterized protein YaaN involved in tellurite resistance|nr:toxic anion resistance protein [Deferribacteraceae bacterium]
MEATMDNEITVKTLKDEIDIYSSNSILAYGTAAQNKSSEFMTSILNAAQTKDIGDTGELLGDLMVNLKKFDANSKGGNFITRLFSSAKSQITSLQASYSSAETNINRITQELESHRRTLMENVALLDKLYEKNLEYAEELQLYITAGEEKLAEVRNETLPALKKTAEGSDNQLDAQRFKDTVDAENRLEKKITDLKLTRTIALQSLPQIRLQQSGSNVLVDKIHSSIVNSIPLWKGQMVLALGLNKNVNAIKAQQSVTQTTNELLRRNSELLKTSTIEAAKESERTIVDIDTLKKANEDIITSIQQVVAIQQEGRQKRQEAEAELVKLEKELKERLIGVIAQK